MTAKRKLYDLLGIAPDAKAEEVRAAFRKKAKSAHPDGGGSSEDFHSLTRALAVLSDPIKRAKYDATGEEGLTEPDNSQAEAMSLLASVFDALLTRGEALVYCDVVGEMRGQMEKEIASAKKDIQKTKFAKAVVERITKKFKRCKGANPLLGALMARKLQTFDAQVDTLLHVIKVREDAYELLKGWSFEVDMLNTAAYMAQAQAQAGTQPPTGGLGLFGGRGLFG